ncbi:MAG: SPFH/Band 7/PHB domain protein [Okeania sp. SIO2D1]|nr:SPFH/Band 7/PHB domain protein [Okeania sp. SIO2D1]
MFQLLLVMLLSAGVSLGSSIRIIKQEEMALVETFGRYNGKRLEAGLNFITPFISQVVFQATSRETVLDIPPQNCITRDNVSIRADAVVYWRIMNVEKAYYKVQDLKKAMINLVLTQIRSELGKLELNETFVARSEVNENLLRELDVATEPWGVKVTRVELRDIVPSKTVQGAMELQMSAEREKQAEILTSQGKREAALNRAKGQADAQILQAEARQKVAILDAQAQQKQQLLKAQGTAAAMGLIAEKLQHDPLASQALQFLLAQNYLEMGAEIGCHDSSKVLFADPRSIANSLEGMQAMVSDLNGNGHSQFVEVEEL